MTYIALIAVIGILLLQATGAIPLSSVGGPLTIGLVFIAAALAVGIHEAWTNKRGVLGWVVNIVVSFVGALVGAQAGGFVIVMLLGLTGTMDGSIAKTGGFAPSFALAGGMLATLAGAWGALWIVNRWR
ncbi:MAG: hypothetical protein F9K38_11795 [Pseudorhodoplanes sp.]|nr:MAG: hypothetical protein F9K38_11795 [Pseudorhodoplanes sp.]